MTKEKCVSDIYRDIKSHLIFLIASRKNASSSIITNVKMTELIKSYICIPDSK